MVPAFTENFKVIKQLKYVIPPGGQCMFKVKTRWVSFNPETYQLKNAAADYGIYRPSFGRDVFFRWHGQPVHDSTPANHAKVDYGGGALDIVSVKKYWFNHSLRPVPNYLLASNVNQGPVVAANLPSLPPTKVAEE